MMTYASPVYYPGRQRQSNPAPDVSSVQMPLFSHGDEAQGDTISSHNSPVVPGGQVQINCLGFSRSILYSCLHFHKVGDLNKHQSSDSPHRNSYQHRLEREGLKHTHTHTLVSLTMELWFDKSSLPWLCRTTPSSTSRCPSPTRWLSFPPDQLPTPFTNTNNTS